MFLHGMADFTPVPGESPTEEQAAFGQRQQSFMGELVRSAQGVAAKGAELRRFIIDEWFPQLYADPKIGKRQMQELFGDLDFSWLHMVYQWQDLSDFDARPGLAKIRSPSLVVAGTHDLISPAKVRQIQEQLPDADYVEFENSGHFAPLEETARFNEVVREFLNRVPRSP